MQWKRQKSKRLESLQYCAKEMRANFPEQIANFHFRRKFGEISPHLLF